MRRGTLVLALLLTVGVSVFIRWRWSQEKEPVHNPRDAARVEPSPLAPWRNPELDLSILFPLATNYVSEARVVSGLTVPIQKKLGRLMHPDENPLLIHRARRGETLAGSVLVTRIKAEHGGIEIVIGIETNGTVRGVLIQSQRETPEIARAITNAAWLGSFTGRTAQSPLRIGEDLPDVPEVARFSAQSIANGVRDQLTVLTFAEMGQEAREQGRLLHH